MRKYIYAALMIIYIGSSIATINYASKWMGDINFTLIGSKARDIAVLTAKNFRITNSDVAELKSLGFMELHTHPVNLQLWDMFNNRQGFDDIRYVYIMTKLNDNEVKYRVTEEYKDFYHADVGTPLNLMWLVDTVVHKTVEQVLAEDPTSYDDIRRYSYTRPSNATAFDEREPVYRMADDEYGTVISGMAPVYTAEGAFVGMLCADIYIEEYDTNASSIRVLLLIVFLLPSVILTSMYIVVYVINVKAANTKALTDALTTAKNRRYMEKNLPKIIREHHRRNLPLSIIMFDVDHFKAYNDNYGHQQGDVVLTEITKAVNSILRVKTDTICRYGGEEFLVILTQTKTEDADKVAERIKAAINGLAIKHDYNETFGIVTVSQGVYSAVPSITDSDKTFVECADKGLYQAKESGRNKYVRFTGV